MTTTPQPRCPNCHAAVPLGKTQCICGLDVSKFNVFARAKKAALQKGLRTKMEAAPPPWWKDSTLVKTAVALGVVLLIVAGVMAWRGSRPEPWEAFPTAREEVVKQLMTHLHADNDKSLRAAYLLVADEDKKNINDDGKYRQLFHEVNKYLAGEFGDDWIKHTTITPDPADADRFIVKVALETLHVRTSEESPKNAPAAKGKHFAYRSIEEFDLHEAANMQKMAGIGGVLKGLGASGSANQLNQIIGAGAHSNRETLMQTKRRLLPILRNPRGEAVKRCVYQTWRIRNDPVVHNRLQAIVDDGRYAGDVQDAAKSILDGSVTEEELAAVGVEK